MSTEVKVGQVWRDKDKRRNTVIEIISVPNDLRGDAEVTGLVVGTEETRSYQIDRLVKRWSLEQEKKQTLEEELEEIIKEVPEKVKHKTREQWLEAAVKELTKLFTKAGYEVPQVRVSVGWPGGRGKKANVIGQCFATTSTDDKVAQIFVSPTVADPLKALVVLAHELIHAVDDCQSGHKKTFIKIAKELGFTPKWTVATPDTITDAFKEKLEAIAERLGAYPHSAIRPTDRPVVQKTYMVLVESVDCDECDEGYKLRMTQKWLDEVGAPLCPHKVEMVPQEK